jgi:hypothetical protein
MHDDRQTKPGLLCISTYEKGQAFLKEAARLGCDVKLLTVHKLAHAEWPKDVLGGFETMAEELRPDQVLPHVERMARHWSFERIVALDEFDLETAAFLREQFRLPGMGQTATRFFRDKLAMRLGAQAGGVAVPEFCSVVNHDELWRFLSREHSAGRGPWMLKPRWSASAIGIKKFEQPNDVWPLLEQLGDGAGNYLVERFVPGEIYHVEGITYGGELLFEVVHKYAQPPFDVMHSGGVFSTRTLPRESADAVEVRTVHGKLLRALGMRNGVTHTEFIRAKADGKLYFLETAARVGGAFIAEVTEAGNGVNPWVEWARMEAAALHERAYELPLVTQSYAGSVICLARQEWPDTSTYTDPEIVYRVRKHHHAGLIVRADQPERVEALLGQYMERFGRDFYTRLDAPDKPTS